MTQRIMPAVWCNNNAAEAAQFYADTFREAAVLGQAPGMSAEVEIHGFTIVLINGGDEFSPNPAISFLLNFDPQAFGGEEKAIAYLDELHTKLSGGGDLMPLDEYPFSKRYAWVRDNFGVTWQLMLTNPEGQPRPFLTPSFMFGGVADGNAEPATEHWIKLFDGAKRGNLVRWGAEELVAEGTVMFTDFQLKNQWLSAMDAGTFHEFTFTPGISMMVLCQDQAEIDHYWVGLSAVPEAERCGWCIDKWGVSWQVLPDNIGELMSNETTRNKLLQMGKIELAELQ